MKKLRVLFVFTGKKEHPVFEPLEMAIHADKFNVNYAYSNINVLNRLVLYTKILTYALKMPRDYNLIISQDFPYAPIIAKKLGLLNETKIAVIVANVGFARKITTKNKRYKISYNLLKYADILICPSVYRENAVKKVYTNKKTIVVYGFPNPYLKKELKRIKHSMNLDSYKILIIAGGLNKKRIYGKGVDLAIESFNEIKKLYPKSELTIIGNHIDKKFMRKLNKTEGIIVVNNPDYKLLANIIKKSALYLHLGRDDAFPTSVLDAMTGGLPVIVSNQTGSIDFMDKLDKNLVCNLDIKDISNKIKYYFDLNTKKKKELSKRAIKIASHFDQKLIVNKFKKDLIKALR